jgi:hypothetical protein
MMLLWACAGVPLGAYNVSGHFNIALQVQPQILTVLSLITWIQCYYYDDVGKFSSRVVELRDADLGCRNGVSQNVVSLLEPSAQYLGALKQDWYLH